MQKIDREVEILINKKVKEFSFHIKEELDHYPEIDTLQQIIQSNIDNYKMSKKFGRVENAKIYKITIQEIKFAKQHLIRVMNMDFTRPTQKMLNMASKSNINLQDPKVIEEFKIIQQQMLQDIQRMKDGKKPLTEAEIKAERTKSANQRHEARIRELIQKQKEEHSVTVKNTERIVELISKSKQNLEANLEFD